MASSGVFLPAASAPFVVPGLGGCGLKPFIVMSKPSMLSLQRKVAVLLIMCELIMGKI